MTAKSEHVKALEAARERLALHLELVIEAPSGNIVMVATASGSEIQPDIGTAEAWIKARLAAQEAP